MQRVAVGQHQAVRGMLVIFVAIIVIILRRAPRAPSPILVDEASDPCRGSCSHEQCFEGFPDHRFYKVGSAFGPASLRAPDRWGQLASRPDVGGAQRSPGLNVFAEPEKSHESAQLGRVNLLR